MTRQLQGGQIRRRHDRLMFCGCVYVHLMFCDVHLIFLLLYPPLTLLPQPLPLILTLLPQPLPLNLLLLYPPLTLLPQPPPLNLLLLETLVFLLLTSMPLLQQLLPRC